MRRPGAGQDPPPWPYATLRALRTGVNVLNPLHAWPNRATYEFRLCKYASRGWPVAVPALDVRRIDVLAVNRTPLNELKVDDSDC